MLKKIIFALFIAALLIVPATAQAQTQSLNLKTGFNFVSFTLKPALAPSVLMSQNPSINEIYTYSPSSGSFLSVSEGTILTLNAGKGYIIRASATAVVNVAGTEVSTIGAIGLKAGFNLVGISKAVAAAKFSEIITNNSMVNGIYKWNASSGSFIQVVRNLSGIAELLDGLDSSFTAGQSYFINIKSDTTLNYDGGSLSFGGGSTTTQAAAPVISPAGGTFTSAQQAAITTATSGATIKYTTDGSTPSATVGTTYGGAITVSATTTIKAVAIKTGMTDSVVTTAIFTINAQQPSSLSIDLGGGVSIEMIKISAGTFQMGDAAVSAASPAHSVTITKDFYVSKYEITQGQWTKIMGSNPSLYKTGDNYPVETISWSDCQSFIAKMNQNYSSYGAFKLPTEAEWEYAARGGTTTSYYWGGLMNSLYAWYGEGGTGKHHAVGLKQPNAFGLYDVTGNVWEFCNDYYSTYSSAAATDPAGPASGASVAIRGASYYDNESESRTANRHDVSLTLKQYNIGFRLVLAAGQVPVQSKVETPAISPNSGTFTAAQQVAITTTTAGATIKYTLDGSTPSAAAGTTYGGAITVSATTTIKAVAIKAGLTDSDVATAVFTISTTQPPVGGSSITIDLGGGVMLEMVKIPAGTFQMGSPESEPNRFTSEGPIHAVTISKEFYIGKYEMTQGQWKAIMNGANPSKYQSGDNYPVESVSWNDICQSGGFLEKINALKPGGYSGFRLPTEAEWEYACRANTTTAFYWGALINDDYLWYTVNSGFKSRPVGSVPGIAKGINVANGFGLYDMSGNVYELCGDFYAPYAAAATTDPQGPATGTNRVERGGCWYDDAKYSRLAIRVSVDPSYRSDGGGFRLVLPLAQTQPQTRAAAPVIAPNGGTFTSAQQVTITTTTSGATIKYTTDGSTPSATAGTTYGGAITVSATTTIKAVAIKTGMTDSDIASAAFTISATQPPVGGQALSIDLGGGVMLEMVKINPGSFKMGDTTIAIANPVHDVTITKAYYIGKYEVTAGQWKKIMLNSNPSGAGDNFPAASVSYSTCKSFINALNSKVTAYGTFRMPTEAEWEYACRAGTKTLYYWNDVMDSNYCWYKNNSGMHTNAVGQKLPNAWGLYDMSGNVWEMCSDWYGPYTAAAQTDPAGPSTFDEHQARVLRGGSWLDDQYCFSGSRNYIAETGYISDNVGLRLALTPLQ